MSGFLSDFWDTAQDDLLPALWKDVAVPYISRAIGGQSSPDDYAASLRDFSRVNGSGPNDRVAAQQSPNTLWDFLLGKNVTTTGEASYSYVPLMILGGAALAIAALIFWRR